MKNKESTTASETVRLDRWLWASRFYKTRALAKQAVVGGKVHLNGQRSKAGKILQGGELLMIRRGDDLYTIEVIRLAQKRGPAKVAMKLYEESEESISLRLKAAEMRRAEQLSDPSPLFSSG